MFVVFVSSRHKYPEMRRGNGWSMYVEVAVCWNVEWGVRRPRRTVGRYHQRWQLPTYLIALSAPMQSHYGVCVGFPNYGQLFILKLIFLRSCMHIHHYIKSNGLTYPVGTMLWCHVSVRLIIGTVTTSTTNSYVLK